MTTAFELFGTAEPRPERRALRAGPLAAVLEAGALREVRWHGVLVLRGIAWLLRDAAWGTPPLVLSDLAVEEAGDRFAATYALAHDGPAGALSGRARIEGTADGRLRFEVSATVGRDVRTNRMGFVVLHPDAAAGLPLLVVHDDGAAERTAFPRLVAPDQPAFSIRALEHAPAPGVTARVAFEGDPFEMEDQRNWLDASFKTYVRPLAWPFPYAVPAGTTDRQAVALTLAGHPEPEPAPASAPAAPTGAVPALWLRLDPAAPVPGATPLPGLAHGLVLRLRARAPDAARVAAAAALARAEGMDLAVEAVLPQRDPAAEAAAVLAALGDAPVSALLLAAERDGKTRPSGTLPDGEAPLADALAALRAAGFAGTLGAGVAAFFTEFNRNPPPPAALAFFGASAIVHAADDASVMETPGVLPAVLDSAAALVPGAALLPGPLAIAAAAFPYGDGPAPSDGTARVPMAARDPRHGALFGAAHLVAVLAALAGRVEAAAPLFLDGPLGLSDAAGAPVPLAFVHAEAAAARGRPLRAASLAGGAALLAWEAADGPRALAANLSDGPVALHTPFTPARLDRLAPGPAGWSPVAAAGGVHVLGPFETVRAAGA